MAETRVKRWFIAGAAVTAAAVAVYAASFWAAFDRKEAGVDPGFAGALVGPAMVVSLVGIVASLALLGAWLSSSGRRSTLGS